MSSTAVKKVVEKQTVNFGDICREVKLTTKDPIADGYDKYIGLEHLDSGSLKIKRWGSIAEDSPSFTRIFKKGHILFGKRRPYLKKAAIAEFVGICSSDIIVMETKSDLMLPELLPFIVQSDKFWDWAVKTSSGSLSPRTKFSSLIAFQMVLPNVYTQNSALSALRKIEGNFTRYFDAVESFKRLENKISFDMANVETDTSKPMKLGGICSLTNGNSFKTSEWSNKGLPIIRIQNLNGNEEFNYYSGVVDEKWRISSGDLLFAWSGVKGSSFGPFIWRGGDAVLNQHIFKVAPTEGVSKEWLYFLMKKLTRIIEATAHGFKSTLVHVKKSEIQNITVHVPDFSQQEKIATLLLQAGDTLRYLSNSQDSLKQTRQELNSQLMDFRGD